MSFNILSCRRLVKRYRISATLPASPPTRTLVSQCCCGRLASMFLSTSQGCAHGIYQSPLGSLLLVASSNGLQRLAFDSLCPPPSPEYLPPCSRSLEFLHDGVKQLEEYFSGRRHRFDLPVDVTGTAFQREVWAALLDIPLGLTASYQQMAICIGRPRAIRAVGTACRHNPLPVVLPCHRVLASNGSLAGFSGGIAKKQWLLQHEKRDLPEKPLGGSQLWMKQSLLP